MNKNMDVLKALLVVMGVVISTPTLADVPIIDDQPTPTESCPITNTSHTENSAGTQIGARHYECITNDINVVWSVSIPKACESGGCGLIVDNHGATMSAAQQNAGTKLRQYGWKATNQGALTPYVVAQPNLTDLFDEQNGLDFDSVMGGAYSAEIPGMTLFIQDLISSLNIDTNRTHMYGFSRGASTTSVYYCDPLYQGIFASYAVGGGGVSCAIKEPLLLLNGKYDPGKMDINNAAIDEMKAKGGITKTIVQKDNNWGRASYVWSWTGLHHKGKVSHIRYETGNFVLESIKHSGLTYPLAGHCHPVSDYNNWLNCYATMETGEKLVSFFINNPR